MRIGICEDNEAQRSLMENYIRSWAAIEGMDVDLSTYDSAESFLFQREDEGPFDVLLLDIQMAHMSGVSLAKTIRQEKDDVIIIFVTALKEHVFEGYDVEALQYLLKPVNKDKLYDSLNMAVRKMNQSDPSIIIEQEKIKVADIQYVEVQAHDSQVVLFDRLIRIRTPLKEMHQMLSKYGFVLSHRAFLVNIDNVSKIDRSFLRMDNGNQVPLSRSRYKAINQAFINHHQERETWI